MKTLPALCTAIVLVAISLNSNAQTDNLTDNPTPETNTLRWQAVYPVPVISSLTLSVNSPAESPAVVRLIDALGRTAFERPVALSSGNNSFEVSMDDMPAGFYQLVLQTDNKRLTYRLLKAQ